MDKLKCQFCNKNFSVKSSLKTHQKSAKYCIKIQNDLNKQNKDVISFNCEFCKKNFTSKHRYEGHMDICVSKLKKIIDNKDKIIENKDKELIQVIENKDAELKVANDRINELELKLKTQRLEIENELYKQDRDTITELAKQPKITNNTQNKIIVATPLDLSSNRLSSIIDSNLSEEHLTMGQKGIAQFAYNNFLKDDEGKLKYVCTDPSRQIFQYKNKEGDMEKDVRASKLTKALCDADIKHKSHEILSDFIRDGDNESVLEYIKHYQNIRDMETDNSDFSKELTSLVV